MKCVLISNTFVIKQNSLSMPDLMGLIKQQFNKKKLSVPENVHKKLTLVTKTLVMIMIIAIVIILLITQPKHHQFDIIALIIEICL